MTAPSAVKPRNRIVVVDDEEQVARSIARALRHHDVQIAHTAAAGSELVRTFQPDLLITDFYLPDGTGREIIAALRYTGSHAPVLLMSGAVDVAEWADWAVSLADDFLSKPFLSDHLRAKTEKLLENYEFEKTAVRQRAELDELHAAQAREAEAARTLLHQMLKRGEFDPARVRVETLTAGMFGGDVVLGKELWNGQYRWLVGDVTGHTLASALVTIPIAQIFYAPSRGRGTLAEVMQELDRELGEMLPVSMFVATAACELNRGTGTLEVCNAGLPDVVIKRANGGLDLIASSNPPLGILRGKVAPEVSLVRVQPGDRIFMFSDGIVEHCSDNGALFGFQRVCQLLGGSEPEHSFERLRTAWRDHAPGVPLADDLSIIEVIV